MYFNADMWQLNWYGSICIRTYWYCSLYDVPAVYRYGRPRKIFGTLWTQEQGNITKLKQTILHFTLKTVEFNVSKHECCENIYEIIYQFNFALDWLPLWNAA